MLFVILFFKILDDPPDDDPSPGCGRKIPARTFMFTVSALNASVYLFLYRRKALQKSDVGILVVINDHARVQNSLRVNQVFDLFQYLVCRLLLEKKNKGRHVSPRAVLGLKSSIVFLNHHRNYLMHEGIISGDLCLVIK